MSFSLTTTCENEKLEKAKIFSCLIELIEKQNNSRQFLIQSLYLSKNREKVI
jgi:hypothetical protein